MRPNWPKLSSLARKHEHFRNFQFCICVLRSVLISFRIYFILFLSLGIEYVLLLMQKVLTIFETHNLSFY